jgi:hypothetical protein
MPEKNECRLFAPIADAVNENRVLYGGTLIYMIGVSGRYVFVVVALAEA